MGSKQNWLRSIKEGFLKVVCGSESKGREQGRVGLLEKGESLGGEGAGRGVGDPRAHQEEVGGA